MSAGCDAAFITATSYFTSIIAKKLKMNLYSTTNWKDYKPWFPHMLETEKSAEINSYYALFE